MDEQVGVLSLSEAARRLGIHPNTLRTWSDKGMVATVKLPSGHRRFTTAEIARLRKQMGLETPDGGKAAA